jgi:hypothetical protein
MRYDQCYVTVIYAVKRWKSSAVYQLGGVRTYAMGDVDGAATCWRSCSRAATTAPPRMRRETDLGKLTYLVLEGEDMAFI